MRETGGWGEKQEEGSKQEGDRMQKGEKRNREEEGLGGRGRLNQQWHVALAVVISAFPFTPNFTQSISTHFKILAHSNQQFTGGLRTLGGNPACNPIGPLSLGTVVDEHVFSVWTLHLPQGFRIES